jgi:uncharacterized membrane protein YjfL (UPF0719 family)
MNQYVIYAIDVLVAILLTLIVKVVADWRTKDIDDDYEIEENSNFAVGIRRGGLYLGGFIIMIAAIIGKSNGLLNDTLGLLYYGIIGYVLLFIARFINDKILLFSIPNDNACKAGNKAVGIVEFGSYLASGLIIHGSILGDSTPILESNLAMLVQDLSTIGVFFILGQIALVIGVKLYELFTPFSWINEIKADNVSAGIMASGMMISLGIIVRKSIIGQFVSWKADLTSFGISLAIGFVALFVLVPVLDKIFLPHTTLNTEIKRDKNNAAVFVAQALNIGIALLIATII